MPKPTQKDHKVIEDITVVTRLLKTVVSDESFLTVINEFVGQVNRSKKLVSLLHKLLCLNILKFGGKLPTFTQGYFSDLHTCLVNEKKNWEYGERYQELRELLQYRLKSNISASALSQVMSASGIKMAAELKTHVKENYEKIYLRWRKVFRTDDPDDTKHRLDPDKTDVEILVKHLWEMRKDFEKNKMKGFAIFPEASIDYGYVHLDSTALAHIFLKDKKEKFKREELLDRYPWIFKDGKRRNKKIYILPQELVKEKRKQIFESLFHLEGKIFKCRNLKTHHFRYSLQTDGVGVKLSFGKWREIPNPKLKKQEQKSGEADKAQDPKSAKKNTIPLKDLEPGNEYSYQVVSLNNLEKDLDGITIRSADTGVKNMFVWAEMLTGDKDVRKTIRKVTTRGWRNRTKKPYFTRKRQQWHNEELKDVQKELNQTPYRTSSCPTRYRMYVENLLKNFEPLWNFAGLMKRRRLRFEAQRVEQREIYREVNRMTRCRRKGDKVVLIVGDAAKRNIFGKTKRNHKGTVPVHIQLNYPNINV